MLLNSTLRSLRLTSDDVSVAACMVPVSMAGCDYVLNGKALYVAAKVSFVLCNTVLVGS